MRIIFIMVCCICLALSTLVLAAEPVSLLAAAEGLRNADAQVRLTAVGQLFTLARGGNYQAALAMGSALPDTDIHVRNLARQYFENLSDPALLEAVLAATHDREAEIRRQAMFVLSILHFFQQREYAFVAPQLAGLADPDKSVREAAHWSLQQIHDSEQIQMLLGGLQREYGQGLRPKGLEGGYPRGKMLVALGWPADANPVPQVMSGLTSQDPYVRRWSAWLAGWMDQLTAILPLQKMLVDDNLLVRLGAAEGLGRIFDPAVVHPLVTALRDTDPEVRRQVVLALGNAIMYAVQYQMNVPDHYVDAATVTKAKALEVELKEAKAGEALMICLKDKEALVRQAAVGTLAGFQKLLDVVPALLPLLKDPDAGVVRAAVFACQRSLDARAVAPLMDALQAHPELEDMILTALGNIGGEQVITLLIRRLREGNEQQRVTTASLLAGMRDPKLVDVLLLALNDASESVRFQTALNFSGAVKDARLTDRFCSLLSDPSADVRQASGRALARLQDAKAVTALCKALMDPDVQVRMRASEALGAIKDPKAVDSLIAALHDENTQNRVEVLYALWNIGDRKAVPAIIAMLKDANTTVRYGAVQALTQLSRQNFGTDTAKWQAWWEEQGKIK